MLDKGTGVSRNWFTNLFGGGKPTASAPSTDAASVALPADESKVTSVVQGDDVPGYVDQGGLAGQPKAGAWVPRVPGVDGNDSSNDLNA